MKIPNPLAGVKSEHVLEGRYWLSYTQFGGLLPLYAGAALLWMFGSALSFGRFVDHGEFAIYSAGLLASALFVVGHEYRTPFPQRTFWQLVTAILLVFSVIVFAVASSADASSSDKADSFNHVALRVVSLILYAFSVATAFVLTVFKESMTVPDIEAIRGDRMAILEGKFDDLEKSGDNP